MARERPARRFVERRQEMERLTALAAHAATGDMRVALVSGDAGVGKSRLVHEFLQRSDARVLVGSCLPLGEHGVPLSPIVEMLRELRLDDPPLDDLPAGLDALTPDRTGLDPAVSTTVVYQAVLDLVERLTEREPLLLVIEDLHWADRSTRELVSFLIPNLRSRAVLMVVTYRTDDVHRSHPLRPVLAELARNDRVECIDVRPFAAPLVAEQIRNLSGSTPTEQVLDSVMERTGGNPYFVELLVDADGLDGRPLPASRRDLLLTRLDCVSEDTRGVVRVLALAGEPVREDLLARVAGRTIEEIRAAMREAVDARLLVATPHGAEFVHALLREVLQHDVLPGERVDHHAAFAAELERQAAGARGDRAGLLARLAFHREHARDLEGAMRAWRAAADAAEQINALAEGHRHLANILSNWTGVDDPVTVCGASYDRIAARAAEFAFLSGRAEDACALVREAIELLDPVAEPRRAGVLHERLGRYLRSTPERDLALEECERALELVPSEPPSADRARVLAGVGTLLMIAGRYEESQATCEAALAVARSTGATSSECDALVSLGVVTCSRLDVDAGLELLGEARRLAADCGDAYQHMRAYWNGFACCFDACRLDEAYRLFEEMVVELPLLGHRHQLPELYSYGADVLMRLGRWDDAAAMTEEGRRRFPYAADDATLVDLLVGRGHFDDARRIIAGKRARNVYTDQEQRAWPLVQLADIETWEGDHAAARDAVDRALDVIGGIDAPIATGYALAVGARCEADVAESARRTGDHDGELQAIARCARVVRRMHELLSRPGPRNGWKREINALSLQCAAEMDRSRGSPASNSWRRAADAWRDLSIPYPEAYCRVRFAEACVAADDRGSAAASLVAAHEVVEALGAEPLGRQIEALARRARIDIGVGSVPRSEYGLTSRELDVLGELVTGATNRQIATTLFISPKTASVHVSNVIRKLGVSNRGEAAAVARDDGLVPT